MVHDQVHQHPDPSFVRLFDQTFHIVQRAEHGIDLVIIRDIISVIRHRGFVDRTQPDHIDPELFEVVKMFYDPRDIPDAVSVRILKAFRVDLIPDRIVPPFLLHYV